MRSENYYSQKRVFELVKFALSPIPQKVLGYGHLEPKIDIVYESYSEASDRITYLAKLPVWLTLQSITFGMHFSQALFEETGRFENVRVSKDQQENVRLRMQRVEYGVPSIRNHVLVKRVSQNVEAVLGRADSKLLNCVTAILPALLVAAWTAFETMSEDLLHAVIKLRPQLSPGKGRHLLRQMPPHEGLTLACKPESTRPNSGKGYKLSFRSVKDIRDAYYITIHKDARRIDRLMLDRNLDTLHAVRNIIVHKAGRADALFIARVAGVPRFAKVGAGDLVQLDFSLVKEVILPAMVTGIKLVRAVDDWVKRHP